MIKATVQHRSTSRSESRIDKINIENLRPCQKVKWGYIFQSGHDVWLWYPYPLVEFVYRQCQQKGVADNFCTSCSFSYLQYSWYNLSRVELIKEFKLLPYHSVDVLWWLGPIHKVILVDAIWIDQVDHNAKCKYFFSFFCWVTLFFTFSL